MSEPAVTGAPQPPRIPTPDDFGLPGEWRIRREPQTAEDWALETRLRTDEIERRLPLGGIEWATGQRPGSRDEWDLEYHFRQLEQRSRERQLQLELEYRKGTEAAKADRQGVAVRSWALLGILAAVVLMPAAAMGFGVAAEDFSQFIAPITGIAGTIIGYWFGQRGDGASTAAPSSTPVEPIESLPPQAP